MNLKNRLPLHLVHPLLGVVVIGVLVRTWSLYFRDLPSGDEINTYIYNAQKFAYHFSLPSLDNFPFTAVVYGLTIRIVDALTVSLSGVIAHYIFALIAGITSVIFTYLGIKRLSGNKPALFAAVLLAVYPGTMFVFRADISLYYILAPLLLYSLVLLVDKPSNSRVVLPGIVGALFYMSRSDGLFFFAISILLFTVYYRSLWRKFILVVVVFVLAMVTFVSFDYLKNGSLGGGANNRAIAAFYQAEGLMDGQGGDWHEYSKRGLERFGPPEDYHDSMIVLGLKNYDVVFARSIKNLALIKTYLHKTGLPAWLLLLLVLAGLLSSYSRAVVLFALPCILTSAIYLAFYYQISYFAILSFGIVVAASIGLLHMVQIVCGKIFPNALHAKYAEWLTVILIAGFYVSQTAQLNPPRTTSAYRYWDALTFIKENCQKNEANCFFAPPYKGSNAMPIFVDIPGSAIEFGAISRLPQEEQRGRLADQGLRYLLCGREHRLLWMEGPTGEDVSFINQRGDVKIVALGAGREFENSRITYYHVSPESGWAGLDSLNNITSSVSPDSLDWEVTGPDPFVVLPELRTGANSTVVLKIHFWSPTDTKWQLFYKNEQDPGFQEDKSTTRNAVKGLNTVYFTIPAGKRQKITLRLDPGGHTGAYKIHEIEARAI